jgi:hypothetical protein
VKKRMRKMMTTKNGDAESVALASVVVEIA